MNNLRFLLQILPYCMFFSIAVFFGYGKNAGSGGIGALIFGWAAWAVLLAGGGLGLLIVYLSP